MLRLAVVPCVLALVLTFGAADAFAHVELLSSSPAKNAKVAHAPSSVSLTFSGPIRSGKLSVNGPGGRVSTGSGGRDPRNIKRLLVALRHGLASGRYSVKASVVAADGHSQSWTYSFTVGK
ncbi:MAG TPA: copper resistance protein CopC [Solirubrobacter sp.]